MHLPDHIIYEYRPLAGIEQHKALAVLSVDELDYLEAVTHQKRRREYVAGRFVAKHLASSVLQCPAREVVIRVADDGSLELPDTGYHITLAHSHTGVCSAIANDSPVGIDLELIKPRDEGLARFILHHEEYSLLETLDLERNNILILCWSLKEATLKGMKTGFRCSPKKLRLSIDVQEGNATIKTPTDSLWYARFEECDGNYLAVAYPE